MPPATAELAASLPAGVCSMSSIHGGLPWPHWMKQTTATSLSPSYSPLFLFITFTITQYVIYLLSDFHIIFQHIETLFIQCSKPETIPITAHWSFTKGLRRGKKKRKRKTVQYPLELSTKAIMCRTVDAVDLKTMEAQGGCNPSLLF